MQTCVFQREHVIAELCLFQLDHIQKNFLLSTSTMFTYIFSPSFVQRGLQLEQDDMHDGHAAILSIELFVFSAEDGRRTSFLSTVIVYVYVGYSSILVTCAGFYA